MKDSKIVWSDEQGDTRKKKVSDSEEVVEGDLVLLLRRLTSGKGRTIIEIKGLPSNKSWCKKLTTGLKKSLGVGGAYKTDYIEIHGEKIDDVIKHLENRELKWKKVGG